MRERGELGGQVKLSHLVRVRLAGEGVMGAIDRIVARLLPGQANVDSRT